MYKVLIYIIIISPWITNAQQQDNIWLFGSSAINATALGYQFGNTVFDFSEVEPRIYYDSLITMDFAGTNSSISDNNGSLMLYTNGMQVQDFSHEIILNGDTIGFSDLWEFNSIPNHLPNGDDWLLGLPLDQGALILPVGNNIDQDFIVVYQLLNRDMNGDYHVSSLNYSRIEANESLEFELTLKDEVVLQEELNFAQIQVCRHANGRDWWLIQQTGRGDKMYVYMISKDGISLKNQIEKESRGVVDVTVSQVAFSPDGEFYAIANAQYFNQIGGEWGTVLRVFDFDRCKGELIEIGTDTIPNTGIRGTLEYSPSGQYLYTSTHDELFQYDLHTHNWQQSKTTIAEYDGFEFMYTEQGPNYQTRFGSMALGPDGRIYCIPEGSSRFVHVMEYPNENGMEAEFKQRKIMMPTENFNSIPNFPNYRMGPIKGSSCDSLGIQNFVKAQFRTEEDSTNHLNVRFTDISYSNIIEWKWDFGDGNTFEGKNPYYYNYENDGAYNVCLTVSDGENTNQSCKILYLGVTSEENVLTLKENINIYPNPADHFLNIQIDNYIPKNLDFTIFSNLGHSILSKRMKSNWNQIDVSKLPKGVYYYTLQDSDGYIYSDTFIKI